MLPSTKYYFCKGFSFNKGNSTSHVTFIHESLCVLISTLVVPGNRVGAVCIIILLGQELAKEGGQGTQQGKQRACALPGTLTGVRKTFKHSALRLQQTVLSNRNRDCVLPLETFLLSHSAFTEGYE